jgi:hypothetical protein
MRIFLLFFVIAIASMPTLARDYDKQDDSVVFPGRISKLNPIAKLIRLKITFENSKFLSKNERMEIWNPSFPKQKCLGYVEGRSSRYILIRIPKYAKCKSTIYFTTGSYLHMYSPNLEDHLVTAKELIDVLNKKRTALDARKKRYVRALDSYIEKIDVTNKRYEILRQKLELEWQKELSNLEEDKSKSYALFKHTETKLHEVEFKMQQYRVRDQNMHEDRWSLDPKLYYKK